MINYAEYYVEIYVLSYTVMFVGDLKSWEEPFLAIIYPILNPPTTMPILHTARSPSDR